MRRAGSPGGVRPRCRSASAVVLSVLALALVPGTPGLAAPPGDTLASADGPALCRDRENGDRASSSPSPDGPGCNGEAPREGILLSHRELMALPTSGPGWDAIMARVERPDGGPYQLATRDDGNKDVLAHALAGARLDDDGHTRFVRDRIQQMMDAPRDDEDVLGTLRHLQTYVISADLIDLASLDPALDRRFRRWLEAEIRHDYAGGGGGGSVLSTHDKKPNNFGTHAGATRIAAALYLDDEEQLRAARDIWYGWATGDPEYSSPTRVWTGTDWQCDPRRPAGINAAGCTRDGNSLDGVIPEDQERCGEYSWPPCDTNYIHGAADGMVLSFWMLARQGEDAWAWGDRAALRQMEWKYDVGQPPYAGFRWQIPVIENAYGIDLQGNDPAATSTNFGYADWWAQPPRLPEPDRPGGGWTAVLVATSLAVLGVLALLALRLRGARSRRGP